MLTLPPPSVLAAFAALAVTLVVLWAPRLSRAPGARTWWIAPFGVTLLVAQGTNLVETAGLAALFALILACRLGDEAPDGPLRGFALAVMLALSAAFLAHVVPGFHHPRVLDGVSLGADAAPYTKFLNLDKGLLGLCLLALHAPARALRPTPSSARPRATIGFGVVTVVVLVLTVSLDFARWAPKLPDWWPMWLFSMVFLTALPEEALFRHVVQGGLHTWISPHAQRGAHWLPVAASGVLFGLSHLAGGWTYVALATVAGVGYAWVYAVTGSLLAAVLAHTTLNTLHLFFFTYPALKSALP